MADHVLDQQQRGERVTSCADPFVTYDHLQKMFKAGYPFFSKANIRGVLAQIAQLPLDNSPGSMVVVRLPTVDGIDFLQYNSTESFIAPENANVEFRAVRLEILFLPIDYRILGSDPNARGCERPFHPLNINLAMRGHDAVSEAPLPDFVPLQIEQVVARFENAKAIWKCSQAAEDFKAFLNDSAATLPRIKKIIAFGAHSMARRGLAVNPNRFFMQHNLILELRSFLRDIGPLGTAIQCYVQDPVYMDVDKDVLGAHGVVVLDSPAGFLEVDDATLVLSHDPSCPIREIVSDIAKPAMMIWDKVIKNNSAYIHKSPVGLQDKEVIVRPNFYDPSTPRLEKMINDYTESRFPEQEKYFPAETTIYIRKLQEWDDKHINLM